MQSCPQCHSHVDSGLKFCPVDGADLTGAGDRLIGQLLGDRYVLERRVGEGGMGMVYLGRDRESGEPVAVKLLHNEMLNLAQAVKRFRREGAAAGKLDHPHVVKMRDSGETPDGALFLVMEYVEGQALGDVLHDGGPMRPARVIHIARQVLEALVAAHAEGVIHRDLKPDNIMLCEVDGRKDYAKILDFGIAKILNEESPDNLTRTGMVFGTPEYMSPEQGVGQKIDHRSDIYAAGVVLYEMLCGRRPFEGEDKIAVIAQQISVMPPPPSQRVEGAVIPIPPALEGAIMTAMQKKPGERFQTAADFLHAVDLAEQSLGSWRADTVVEAATSDTMPADSLPPGSVLSGTAERIGTRNGAAPARDLSKRVLLRAKGTAATVGPAMRGFRDWIATGPIGATYRRIPAARRPWLWGGAGAAVMFAVAVAIGAGGEGTDAWPATSAPGEKDAPDPGSAAKTRDTTVPAPAKKPDGDRPSPLGALLKPKDPFDGLAVSSPAEVAALEEMRAKRPDGVLDALAGTPGGTPAVHFLRGRALAMKGEWAAAKPELLQAFSLAPGVRRDRELLENAITVGTGPTKSAAPAREILEAAGKEAVPFMIDAMLAADDVAARLRDEAARLKLEKKKLTPADSKLFADARKKRKTLRKIVEKSDPSADLARIWVSELRDTKDCDGRSGLIRSIRAAKVVAALPVLEEIQKEGTSLFSGNYCIRGILPATVKELRGE